MNTSKNALQGTHTDSGQNAHLQESARGESGGSGDSGNAWLNTPEAIAGRRTLKEVLIDGYCNGLYSHDLVDRHFERYRLQEI